MENFQKSLTAPVWYIVKGEKRKKENSLTVKKSLTVFLRINGVNRLLNR